MTLFNTKLATYLSLGLVLTACDPATIDPESIGTASGGTSTGSSIGLFQLVSDDFNEGDLTNGDIYVSSGKKSGSGTASSPLVFGLGNSYRFTWASSISTDSILKFSLYSPDNPNMEVSLAEIDCSTSSATTTCGLTQEMDCWFVGGQSGSSYFTSFFCKHGEDFVESISSQEAMVNSFLTDWSGEWSDLDLNVGVKVRLCDAISDSSCDVATLGYLKLTEYLE